MYRISQLMSTPVASSTRSNRECTGELAPSCIFPSLAFDFLDGGSPFECCSIDPLTGSHYTCRRSPRLLTNGYYVWTEDSFLCDEDGNITLNPSQTTVMYKENLVRIFRRKKRVRPSLFSLSASQSWLCGSVLGDSDTSPHEDIWLEGARRLDSYHSSENETSVFPGVSFQAVLLTAGFIISLCARWWIGGVLSNVFTCMLVITIAYVVQSLFLSLASYFKATAHAWFARI
ncbi:transmembrane protein 71 isoform X6 [Marmota flaviventris]|uniref:transmembrane protein 71 isoform X6 n=1 Tax=Marmota flaviventris TaxID=93162 RepID=UPI003A846E79